MPRIDVLDSDWIYQSTNCYTFSSRRILCDVIREWREEEDPNKEETRMESDLLFVSHTNRVISMDQNLIPHKKWHSRLCSSRIEALQTWIYQWTVYRQNHARTFSFSQCWPGPPRSVSTSSVDNLWLLVEITKNLDECHSTTFKPSITFRVEFDQRPPQAVELDDAVSKAVLAGDRMQLAHPELDAASSVTAVVSPVEQLPPIDTLGPLIEHMKVFVDAMDLFVEVRQFHSPLYLLQWCATGTDPSVCQSRLDSSILRVQGMLTIILF